MDKTIVVALIGASGAIIAAAIAALVPRLLGRTGRLQAEPIQQPAVAGELLEQVVADRRVRRLLRNPNWEPAANAAIDHFVHGMPASDQWQGTKTWLQVAAVVRELRGGA
jgi:hypothetical protein